MGITQRKVSFYRLSLEKHVLLPTNVTQIQTLSNEEIEEKFNEIYTNNFISLPNGTKAVKIDTGNSEYVVEVIDYDNKRVFIKIGQENDSNTVALRNYITLETEDVPMSAEQLLELYTFCLIDFETCIVSYIGINGAPKLSAIKCLFNTFFLETEKIHSDMASIVTDNVIEILAKKHRISKMSLTVAIPTDKVLSDIGTDENTFYELGEFKTKTATYNLVAKRNKNIFESNSKLADVVEKLKEKFGDKIVDLTVNAKDLDENSQTYDLMQYNFTKTVLLNTESTKNLKIEDFKEALNSTYNTNKDELLLYSKK